jgi:hypothetical protein
MRFNRAAAWQYGLMKASGVRYIESDVQGLATKDNHQHAAGWPHIGPHQVAH